MWELPRNLEQFEEFQKKISEPEKITWVFMRQRINALGLLEISSLNLDIKRFSCVLLGKKLFMNDVIFSYQRVKEIMKNFVPIA